MFSHATMVRSTKFFDCFDIHSVVSKHAQGISSGDTMVVRYHSLAVDPTLPTALRGTAWTVGAPVPPATDGALPSLPCFSSSSSSSSSSGGAHRVLMAVQHRQHPHHGVQFHPESVGSACGERLLSNFRDITLQHMQRNGQRCRTPTNAVASVAAAAGAQCAQTADMQLKGASAPAQRAAPGLALMWRSMELPEASLEHVFAALYSADDMRDTFWLDRCGPFVYFFAGCRFEPIVCCTTSRYTTAHAFHFIVCLSLSVLSLCPTRPTTLPTQCGRFKGPLFLHGGARGAPVAALALHARPPNPWAPPRGCIGGAVRRCDHSHYSL